MPGSAWSLSSFRMAAMTGSKRSYAGMLSHLFLRLLSSKSPRESLLPAQQADEGVLLRFVLVVFLLDHIEELLGYPDSFHASTSVTDDVNLPANTSPRCVTVHSIMRKMGEPRGRSEFTRDNGWIRALLLDAGLPEPPEVAGSPPFPAVGLKLPEHGISMLFADQRAAASVTLDADSCLPADIAGLRHPCHLSLSIRMEVSLSGLSGQVNKRFSLRGFLVALCSTGSVTGESFPGSRMSIFR